VKEPRACSFACRPYLGIRILWSAAAKRSGDGALDHQNGPSAVSRCSDTKEDVSLTVIRSILKKRGQAHLPNFELNHIELLILDGKAFKVEKPSHWESLSGQEGGLAPAFHRERITDAG
jgi:hypothetical protein